MLLFEVFAFDVSLKLPLGLIHWNHSKLFPFPPSSFLSCKHMPRNLLGRQGEWFGLLWTFTVLLLPHLRVPVTDSSSANLKILRVSGAGSNLECSWIWLLILALLIPGPPHVPPAHSRPHKVVVLPHWTPPNPGLSGPSRGGNWMEKTEVMAGPLYSSLSAIQAPVVDLFWLSECLWREMGIDRDVPLTIPLLCPLYPYLSPWPLHLSLFSSLVVHIIISPPWLFFLQTVPSPGALNDQVPPHTDR